MSSDRQLPAGSPVPGATPAPLETAPASPLMSQYLAIKAANPGSLLFYRMGDFYELFFADAETAAGVLGITLTKRGRHQGDDIPMCGVPVHAADQYLERLIRAGHRVAVCEQIEDPLEARKRGAKALVRREVVRLVTPGTLTEEGLLEHRRSNYLLALSRSGRDGALALAWIDISTGEFCVAPTSPTLLPVELARLEPSEIIVQDSLVAEAAVAGLLQESGAAVTPLPASRFDSGNGELRLKQRYSVEALEGFGNFTSSELGAAGALLDYVSLTQVGKLPALRSLQRSVAGNVMLIDAATRSNLELVRTLTGERRGSLLATIDETMTGAGGRLLAHRLAGPLTDVAEIDARLDAVAWFVSDAELRRKLRQALAGMPDMERAAARLVLGRGGPRDLAAVGHGLALALEIAALLRSSGGLAPLPEQIHEACITLGHDGSELSVAIVRALGADLPLSARDGGMIVAGYRSDLDEARLLRDDHRRVIVGLQASYAERTGIKALKIKHNNILGYFVEVSSQHAAALLAGEASRTFIHRQTIASAARFTTVELGELEQKLTNAASRALAIELEIFAALVAHVVAKMQMIGVIGQAVAALDVAAGLAELAERQRFVRPDIAEAPTFRISGGRHPVVAAALQRAQGEHFIANDCDLDAGSPGGRRLWLLTGPNMAGKSTFLRQNAIIAVLAQMGSFVPAAAATVGIVDRLFSRVGAADDLARGRSTFMVEMVETAAILNQATERSLVILDEIGRGTATFDGLSIAWAAVEHLHGINRCRALFATHFHELTALAASLSGLANVTMKVKEWQGNVIFLHEVAPGAADRSYGIQVARRAGLPRAVIDRALEVLHLLESSSSRRNVMDDLPLFSVARPPPAAPPGPAGKIAELLERVAPDELAPRVALDLLYELKRLASDGS
ncbi:MAG: DNA mismatch repair protein MutS [Pseudomonadota bacterium]|nr:DNA mismatch repair protein MutS [Pseudomonadota bacterium]